MVCIMAGKVVGRSGVGRSVIRNPAMTMQLGGHKRQQQMESLLTRMNLPFRFLIVTSGGAAILDLLIVFCSIPALGWESVNC